MSRVCCMGGWCAKRELCALYKHSWRPVVMERVCNPGVMDSFEAIPRVLPPGSYVPIHTTAKRSVFETA